jgi:diguanylate cyclase (GGDEF)-like protein
MEMFWLLTIRPPLGEPLERILKPGKTTIGRNLDNDVVIKDVSASRVHAELVYDENDNQIRIRDLGSTNGTFVNRQRLDSPCVLRSGDQIRIGALVGSIEKRNNNPVPLAVTQPLTRDLLLESVDQHAILLSQVASQLNTVTDMETALSQVSELLQAALGAAKCEVIPSERFGRLAELGFPTQLAEAAIQKRQVVVVPELPDQIPSQSAQLLHIRHAMCMPIMHGDKVIALLYVYKTDPESKPFDQHDVLLAVAISHQAALTIERMRLLNLSVRDPLTNLYNRRYLEEALEREGKLADRQRSSVGVIMLDLDDFKSFNDTYGHPAGDQMLRELGKLLATSVRGSDIACRYGGEEFVLFLPGAPFEIVQRRAEELRVQVSQIAPPHEGQPWGKITVSAGIAAYPQHGATLSAVLRAADTALYLAKQAGRDRVHVAEPAVGKS